MDIRAVQISLPLEDIQAQALTDTDASVGSNTAWMRTQCPRSPKRGKSPAVKSIYASHAKEINSSAFLRQGVNTCANTHSWIDVGLQILLCCGWAPECATPNNIGIQKTLPLMDEPRLFFRGLRHSEIASQCNEQPSRGRGGKELRIYTGTGVMDNIGATACTVLFDNRVVYRNLFIHGQTLGSDRPIYLDEVAILRALRIFHDWLGEDIPPRTPYAR